MRYIPLRKSAFDSIYASYDLARYCGDLDRDIFGPIALADDVEELHEDEEIVLFSPGRQQDGKYRRLKAKVLKADPFMVKVTDMGT